MNIKNLYIALLFSSFTNTVSSEPHVEYLGGKIIIQVLQMWQYGSERLGDFLMVVLLPASDAL